MHDRATTIETFLSATAAKQPTPGGGSVTALAGALSASIGRMVLSYSIGKKDLLPFEPELKKAAHELDHANELLLQFMVEDQEAYAHLTSIKKLPADHPDRPAQLSQAVLSCIRCPQAISATAIAVLGVCDRVVEHVNPWLLSDLAVCGDLAMATVRCGIYNVRVNLSSIENQTQRSEFADDCEKMLSQGLVLIQKITPPVWHRYELAAGK